MDTMDYKSKMGSAILIAAAGAIFGAAVAMFVTTRKRKRKSDDGSHGTDDSLQALRGELDECRKTLEDFRLRLEQETERRNESEAWNRKLEQDLVDLAAGRKSAEEKCVRLCRDLDRVKAKLKEAEAEGRILKIQIREFTNSTGRNTDAMPSATEDLTYTEKYEEQKPKILPKNTRLNTAPEADDTMASIPANFCFTDARVSYVMDDKISDSVEERFLENRLNNRPVEQLDSYEEDFIDDEDDDYSDDDLEELDDSDIAIIQRNISHTSDDNFELGKDVMGALIANAFKDGVIESREGDDVSLSGDVSANSSITTSPGSKPCTEDHGEVSQESIGDIKTTRRFWEQMIAADQLHDDDDVLSDEDDDVTDEEDISDEDDDGEIIQNHTDSLQQRLKCPKTEGHLQNGDMDSSKNLRNSENKISSQDGLSLPSEVIPNGNGVADNAHVNGDHNVNT